MRFLHPQYRDDNRDTLYPFADNAVLQGSLGYGFTTSTFLDAILHPVGKTLPQRLARVVVTSLQATLVIGDDAGDSCSCVVDLTSPNGVLPLSDASGRPAGLLLADVDQLMLIQNWPRGTHLFTSAAFVASVTVPDPQGYVKGISADGAATLSGDVWLVGEGGVILTEEDGTIRIDVVGDPLFRRAQCGETASFAAPNYLKTINNIAPDARGAFHLFASQTLTDLPALRIHAGSSGDLVIELASAGK